MKTYLTIIILSLVTLQSFSQSKKEIEAAQAAKLDSLAKVSAELALTNDSLTKQLNRYLGLYNVIKEDVFKHDFEPEKISELIDSLRATKDSVINLSNITSAFLTDTLNMVRAENASLKKDVEGLKYAVTLLKNSSGVLPTEAKDYSGTWSLNLRRIKMSGTSPQSGMVDVSGLADTLSSPLVKLTFLDGEFAELTFGNDKKAKCFYSVNAFSKTEPYYIDLKGTEADIRLFVVHTNNGLQASYELSSSKGIYYYGFMMK